MPNVLLSTTPCVQAPELPKPAAAPSFSFEMPKFEVPEIKVPEVKVPEIKVSSQLCLLDGQARGAKLMLMLLCFALPLGPYPLGALLAQ
jgi:hypothetical protein